MRGEGSQVCSQKVEEPKKELPRITATRDELRQLKVKDLKNILSERGIIFDDLNEKEELVDRIVQRCSAVTYYV